MDRWATVKRIHQVKVLDFGVAKTRRSETLVTSDASSTDTHTAVGRVVGSLPYMRPEQGCTPSILRCSGCSKAITRRCFSASAGAHAAQGRHVRAARRWGAMHGLLDSIASPLQASIKTLIGDRYIDRAKEALGADEFEKALSEGRAMSLQQAVQYAVADEPPDAGACRSA